MNNNLVDVIIINWNSGRLIRNLLTSFERISESSIAKVIIVDNNSSDNSMDLIEQENWKLDIEIIRNDRNEGFAKACNTGAHRSKSKYLLFLNPDTLIYEGSIEKCVEFLEKDKEELYGACGIQLVDEMNVPNRSCARIPSFSNMVNAALGLNVILPRRFPGVLLKEWTHDSTKDIGHVIGAFYMVRRDVFEKFNGFDERFFLYYEDLDFSTTLHNSDLKIAFLSHVRAVHVGGGCSQQIKAKRLSYSYISKVRYINKHFPIYKRLPLILLTITIEPVMRSTFYLLQLSIKDSIISMQGYLMFLGEAFLNLFRRKPYAGS